jgi:hypothetical protein
MNSERYPNTEQLCIGMFLGLHIILFLFFVLAAKQMPSATTDAQFCWIVLPSALRPYVLNWSGSIRIAPIFVLSWVLMLAAFSLLIQTYVKLRARFTKDSRPVDLGSKSNVAQKESIKQMLIANTVLLWILMYSVFVRGFRGSCLAPDDTATSLPLSPLPIWVQRMPYGPFLYRTLRSSSKRILPHVGRAVIMSVSIASLVLSSVTVWSAQQLALHLGTITDPSGG